jgi:hypothetical protein
MAPEERGKGLAVALSGAFQQLTVGHSMSSPREQLFGSNHVPATASAPLAALRCLDGLMRDA